MSMWIKSSYCGEAGACVEVWRKASRCDTGACVEVAYRKSSRSGNGASNCVEVADSDGCDLVHVRDSKLGDLSPVLNFSRPGWLAFLDDVKTGRLR
jgi:hypothetical protein